MNVVNDDGHAGLGRREPSENASFAAMRMDEVWALRLEKPGELAKGDQVFPWVDRTDEFWNQRQQSGMRIQPRLERAFRAGLRTGHESHFQSGFFAQAKNRGHRVFLGAADDQPGDDMGDAHGRVIFADRAVGREVRECAR